jgi:hypothetical protein
MNHPNPPLTNPSGNIIDMSGCRFADVAGEDNTVFVAPDDETGK